MPLKEPPFGSVAYLFSYIEMSDIMNNGRIILSLMVVVCGLVLSGCSYSQQETYTTYGPEIIITTARLERWGDIAHRVAWELGDYKISEDGSRSFPSFHQAVRVRKDDSGKEIASRRVTEFNDKTGNHCVIEDIILSGKSAIILLKSDTEASTMALANSILRELDALKIKHKG